MAELHDSAGSPFANVYFVQVDSDQQDALVKIISAQYDRVTNAWVVEYIGGPKKGESW